MLTETGRVVAVEQDGLWVQTLRQSTCGSCSAQAGCGHSVLNRLSAKRQTGLVRVLANEAEIARCKVDDQVRIAIPESVVLQASALVYLLPIVLMLIFAMAATTFWPAADLAAVLGAGLGLAVGFWLVRWHANRHRNDQHFQPSLIEVLPSMVQSHPIV